MRMAKASKDDIDKLFRFVKLIEGLSEYDSDSEKIGNIVKRQFPKLCGGYIRVILGCEMLIDNCCDPELSYLDYKKELKQCCNS